MERLAASPGGVGDESLAGRIFFNGSLQATRAGRCERGRELARMAARFDDPGALFTNQSWATTLERYPDCRADSLQHVLRRLRFK